MWNSLYLHIAKFAQGWTNNIAFCKELISWHNTHYTFILKIAQFNIVLWLKNIQVNIFPLKRFIWKLFIPFDLCLTYNTLTVSHNINVNKFIDMCSILIRLGKLDSIWTFWISCLSLYFQSFGILFIRLIYLKKTIAGRLNFSIKKGVVSLGLLVINIFYVLNT